MKTPIKFAAALLALLPLNSNAAVESANTLQPGDNPVVNCYQYASASSRNAADGVSEKALTRVQLDTGIKQCTHALRHYSMRKQVRAQVYLHRGLLHRHLLRSDLALKDFRRARRVGGDSPAISVNIGNVYYLQGDFERAISAYNRALRMEFPAAHKALLNRGLASERLGRAQHAIDAYAAALALEPSLEVARTRLRALSGEKLASFTHPELSDISQESDAPTGTAKQPRDRLLVASGPVR